MSGGGNYQGTRRGPALGARTGRVAGSGVEIPISVRAFAAENAMDWRIRVCRPRWPPIFVARRDNRLAHGSVRFLANQDGSVSFSARRAGARSQPLHHSSAETRHSGDKTRHHFAPQIVL
jgi:hypothetical protein